MPMRLFHLFGLAAAMSAAPLLAQTAYVSNERSSTVSVIDVGSGKVVDTFDVGERPRGILLSRDGKYLYICASLDNAVEIRDRATGALVAAMPAGTP